MFGRGRLNIEVEGSGIAVTVAEDTVAVERVAVSKVFDEVWESDGEPLLNPRRFLGVVEANPGIGRLTGDLVDSSAMASSFRGASPR